MRHSRLFTDQALGSGLTVDLEARPARHVAQVLRLKRGQALTLFNGDGRDWSAELTRCDRRSVQARISGLLHEEPPPQRALHLGIGVSRGERMDFAIQKSVELGVTMITPLRTERSVVQLDEEKAQKRRMHWRGVLIAACEQSGRSRVPVLRPVSQFTAWTTQQPSGLLLDHRSSVALPTIPAPSGDIHLVVGPEGGLSQPEREHAMAQGFTAVRLGPRILRTETAPLAALAAIQTLWGDFR